MWPKNQPFTKWSFSEDNTHIKIKLFDFSASAIAKYRQLAFPQMGGLRMSLILRFNGSNKTNVYDDTTLKDDPCRSG